MVETCLLVSTTAKQAYRCDADPTSRAPTRTAASAARQTQLGPAPHRAFSLSAAWRGALTGALASPSCAPAPRGASGGPAPGLGPAKAPQPRCAAARAPGRGQPGVRMNAAHAARRLPARRLCSSPESPSAELMYSIIASVPIYASQFSLSPCLQSGAAGEGAHLRGVAEGHPGVGGRGAGGAAAAAPNRAARPLRPGRSCDAVWCVVYAASHCVSQLGWRCLVRPRQRTPAMHACSHACLSVQTCSAPGQCRALHSPAYEQVGNMRKLCIDRGERGERHGCTKRSAEPLARAPAHAGAGRPASRRPRRSRRRAARPCPRAPRTRRGRHARPPPLPPSARPSSRRWRASRCSARAARAGRCAAAPAPPPPPALRAPREHGRRRRDWSGGPAAFARRARAGARRRRRARRRPRRPSGGRGRRAVRSASGP